MRNKSTELQEAKVPMPPKIEVLGEPILIQEVGMRDGLQSAGSMVSTEDKIRLLNRLSALRFHKIEVTSFVSSKAVPLLADAEDVLKSIDRNPSTSYTALIPNIRGLGRALKTTVDEVNVVMSVSEAHNLANLRMRCDESIEQIIQIVRESGHIKVNGTLATAFGCPFTGQIDEMLVIDWAQRYIDTGIDSLTIADTIGAATPRQVNSLVSQLLKRFPEVEITLHLHNTRGLGIANVFAGISAGIRNFDASFGGIGGCPYAPGATGNVCTEDLVHALRYDDFLCEVDLEALITITDELEGILTRPLPGLVRQSGARDRIHPMSDNLKSLLRNS
jgi:hydroxymethylglutaryl-CoA lyase